MIVDVHQHYVDGGCYTDYTDYPAQLVDAMDRNGFDWTCLNGLGPAWHNLGNDDVLHAVERFPERIIGVGYVAVDNERVDRIDALHTQGMRGLKIIATLKPYDDDSYLPFYERAAALDMPVLFHTGFLGGDPDNVRSDISSDRYRPMTLDRVARLFPELTVIAAHMGTMMWFEEALAIMTHPNVYCDTSGGPSCTEAEFYRQPRHRLIDWNKAVFGSDSLPNDTHIPFADLKRLLVELDVSAATRLKVMGDTAARLFRLT